MFVSSTNLWRILRNQYELTKNKKVIGSTILYQIKSTIAFGIVAKGVLGGWIEKETNLDQHGSARVDGDARVDGNARVDGKLKLDLGHYFGFLFKNEKIKKTKTEHGCLLSKE